MLREEWLETNHRYIFMGYLPIKHNTNPELNPWHRPEPDVSMGKCEPGTQEVEAGGSECQTVSQRAAGLQGRPCLKNRKC